MEVGDGVRARRPYRISAILEIGDALANAQKAAAQLQDDCEHARKERDAARASEARLSTELWARKPLEDRVASLAYELAEVRAIEKQLCDSLDLLRREYSKSLVERDQARAEATKRSTELWARKPLEDRVASLVEELTNAREDIQKLVKTIATNADQFTKHTAALVQERDAARAEVERLPTALKSAQRARDELQLQVDELRLRLTGIMSAEDVHSMLEEMLDQTEWVGQCLDASTYEQMSCIQRTISVIAQRVSDMFKEDTNAND
jgi:chromosome segregation ATPase